jgi:hypothetical protein
VSSCADVDTQSRLQSLQQLATNAAKCDVMRGVEVKEPPLNYGSKLLLGAIDEMRAAIAVTLQPKDVA